MSKRILICATQVPFVRGGAENLVDGLRDALRERGHSVDVVSLPFSWYPPERIPDSALAWRLLDIAAPSGIPVDQVICTKFPSYLIRHPRKVVWLVHQHRQAYDQYGTPLSDISNSESDRAVRDSIFRMDQNGLGEAVARYTISRNVSERLRRFNRLSSTPLYPPSRYADQLYAGPYGDYILSPARLDGAKRLDLLLQALVHTSSKIRCIFVSDGPDRQKLEAEARRLGLADRVEFRGRVSDQELVDLYAACRAVYYAPVDEDYGFVTVEAFGAARPVVTTNDAGGVLEFVQDGVNGYILEPEPQGIAKAIDRLASDAGLAERLGRAGQPLVKDITWDNVVSKLVLD
jgi:Glycosyltransferase